MILEQFLNTQAQYNTVLHSFKNGLKTVHIFPRVNIVLKVYNYTVRERGVWDFSDL